MTRAEAEQMKAVEAATQALVTYFSEYELCPQDGTILYRAFVPSSSGRVAVRIEVERLRDDRLRGLLGDGIVDGDHVGCLHVVREGRDLCVFGRLAPVGAEALLFVLRNYRNRLCYAPALAGVEAPMLRGRAVMRGRSGR